MDASKLKAGLTAEWFKNSLSQKYTCPTLDVDSVIPPRIKIKRIPPNKRVQKLPVILCFTSGKRHGVSLYATHVLKPESNKIITIRITINPVETLAVAFLGESR